MLTEEQLAEIDRYCKVTYGVNRCCTVNAYLGQLLAEVHRLRAAMEEALSAPALPSVWEYGPHERTAAEIAEEALGNVP